MIVDNVTTEEAQEMMNHVSFELKIAFSHRGCNDCKIREAGKACDCCVQQGERHPLCTLCGWCENCRDYFLEPTFPFFEGSSGWNTAAWWKSVLDSRNGSNGVCDPEPGDYEVAVADKVLTAAARERRGAEEMKHPNELVFAVQKLLEARHHHAVTIEEWDHVAWALEYETGVWTEWRAEGEGVAQ